MQDELQPDFLEDDNLVPLPLISIEFGKGEPGQSPAAPAGSGIEPPPPVEDTKDVLKPDGDPTFINAVSSFYNAINRSPENQQKLLDKQQKNQEIADRVNLPVKHLYQMAALGDERSDILKDLGFELYTPGDDLTRVTNFLWGEQQKYFNGRKEGKKHSELPFSQQLSAFFMPLDALDFIGIGIGVKALIKAGVKKLGSQASKTSVIDLVQDKELIRTLSDSETMSLFEDMKPLVQGGEREAFLRFAKGKPTKKKTAGVIRTKDEAFLVDYH